MKTACLTIILALNSQAAKFWTQIVPAGAGATTIIVNAGSIYRGIRKVPKVVAATPKGPKEMIKAAKKKGTNKMSLALGDIDKESLTALVTQGGQTLDDFITKLNTGLQGDEDHAEADAQDLLKTATTSAQAMLAPLVSQAQALNANAASLIALLTQLVNQGIMVGGIPINLQPAKTQ